MKIDPFAMALLYDYYGELLTEKQKTCFDLYHSQDYSLAEIAAELGISRQGVHDSLLRAENYLKELEDKVGCVARARERRAALEKIRAAAETLLRVPDPHTRTLAGDILRAADAIKE